MKTQDDKTVTTQKKRWVTPEVHCENISSSTQAGVVVKAAVENLVYRSS